MANGDSRAGAQVALVAARPASRVDLDRQRLVDGTRRAMVDERYERAVASPLSGGTALTVGPVVPVLPVDGIDVRLDPDDQAGIGWLVDLLFRSGGLHARGYLDVLIDGRRAVLRQPQRGDRPPTPPSEPGVDLAAAPASGMPLTEAARAAELQALDRLGATVERAWAALYARVGAHLDTVDAHARTVLRAEIAKARAVAAYDKAGLALDADGTAAVADQELFGRFAQAMRSLAGRRDAIHLASRDRTIAEGVLAAASLHALLRLLGGGPGSSLTEVVQDPGTAAAQGLRAGADRDLDAAVQAYAQALQQAAAQFPLAWHLDDDVAADDSDDDLLDWAAGQLGDTHEALDEIAEGALGREPTRFAAARDPFAAVRAEADSTWSVWQYPQVVSLGVASARLAPGSLGWVAALEAQQAIKPEDLRPEDESCAGLLFDAALVVALEIPVVGEVVAVLSLVAAAWRAARQISEARHQRTAFRAALDPTSVLAVPDVPLAGIVIGAIVDVGVNLLVARRALAPLLRPLGSLLEDLANNGLYAARKFMVGASIINELMLGGFGASRTAAAAAGPQAVLALAGAAEREGAAGLRAVLDEARVAAEATAKTGAAAATAGAGAARTAGTGAARAGAGSVAAGARTGAAKAAADRAAVLLGDLRRLAGLPPPPGSTSATTPPRAGTPSLARPGAGGAPSVAKPPAPGTSSSSATAKPPVPAPIPDIDRLLADETLLAAVVRQLVALARRLAPSLAEWLEGDPLLARAATLQILSALRAYTATFTFAKQAKEGATLEQLVPRDVEGIVQYLAGKLNELLAIRLGTLVARLFALANARWAAANPDDWGPPVLAAQVEISSDGKFLLAQDLVVVSPGRGRHAGRLRLWSWGQITLGDPEHLLLQTLSDLARLAAAGARLRVEGVGVFDLAHDVDWAPPLPGSDPRATTGVVGAATTAPSGSVAAGLGDLGVEFVDLPWSADEVRALVRELLRQAGKLGQ
jgi:hypothetical protein